MNNSSKLGMQEPVRGTMLALLHQLWPLLVFPESCVLSMRWTEKSSAGWTAWSGTAELSYVKQNRLQSPMSLWNFMLARRSSSLFSSDRTLTGRMLGRGVECSWGLCLPATSFPLTPPPWVMSFVLPQNLTQPAEIQDQNGEYVVHQWR